MKKIFFLTVSLALILGCSNFLADPTFRASPAAAAKSAAAVKAAGCKDIPPGIPPGIYRQVSSRAAQFLGGAGSRVVFADVLATGLINGRAPFIVDVRGAAAYAAGHIPGAVNIPLAELFKPENLAKLPIDGTPVVTVCVTGHTASMAMSVLGTLGYDAYVLRFAMLGWNASTPMTFASAGQAPQTILGLGGPLNIGVEP